MPVSSSESALAHVRVYDKQEVDDLPVAHETSRPKKGINQPSIGPRGNLPRARTVHAQVVELGRHTGLRSLRPIKGVRVRVPLCAYALVSESGRRARLRSGCPKGREGSSPS